jgi:DnaJ-class molecular chaperone
MATNGASVEPILKPACGTCHGSGWNQAIKTHPVDITAPINSEDGLKTLMDYVRQRLCCPDCDGTGKVKA